MKSCKSSKVWVGCAIGSLLVGSSILLAQVADVPVKAGLWDTQVNVKVVSARGTQEIPATRQACFTAGLTVANYMSAMNRSAGVGDSHCVISNKTETAHTISYDSACTGPKVSSKGHADFKLADADHFSGSSHTTVTGSPDGSPMNTTIDKTFSAKFISSNCGNVEPMVLPPAGK